MTRPMENTIDIRNIESFLDMDACVRLQQSVWQFSDRDTIPRRMFVVSRAVGGQVLGAWEGARLVGFILAVPGIRDGRPYLHSHMLAVLPDTRNCGIGKMLKLAQRKDALARGIDRIEWTFDPMEVKNAYFNIEKLGAVVRRYTPDFYGSSTSPLHGALPTDRMHAEWYLKSMRVRDAIAGKGLPDSYIERTVSVPYKKAVAEDASKACSASALESLVGIRQQFLDAFAAGLTVLRFQNATQQSARYGLGIWDGADEVASG